MSSYSGHPALRPFGVSLRLLKIAPGDFVELLDFIARLAALVPRPRVNLTRYHGVLAPNHRWRAAVTPAGRGRGKSVAAQPEKSAIERHVAMSWAQRLKRVFGIDVESCVRCGQGDRQHRGAGADRTDPGACARERRKQRGIARPTIDRAAGECVSGAGEGGRIGSREAAIRDRQGAVLRAAEMRRDPGDCSGCEGRCAFPGWSCRQDQFAGWIPFRGPGAGAGRTGLALGGALSFLYLPRESRRGWRGG